MKKLYIAAALLLGFTSMFAQKLLNVDGGFESIEAQALTTPANSKGWIYQASSGTATYEITSSEKHSGKNAAKLVVSKLPVNYWDIQMGNENIPAPHGQFYRATFWAKSPTKSKVHAIVGNYNWAELSFLDLTLNTEWTKYTMFCFNTGSATNKDSLRVVFQKFSLGEYYFDDIEFVASCIGDAYVSTTGDSIIINTGADLEPIPVIFENSSFSVSVNGTDNLVVSVTLKKGSKNNIVLRMATQIKEGDKVSVAHKGGVLAYLNPDNYPDDKLSAFTDSVRNNVKNEQTLVKKTKSTSKFSIYPNPVSAKAKIVSSEIIKAIEVTNMAGQKVQLSFGNNFNEMDISHVPDGIYFFKVEQLNGNKLLYKVVKNEKK